MDKLKLISKVMMIVGFISFVGGISVTMKELMVFGLCIGIAGVIGYAIIFLVSSTSIVVQKSISD